MKFFHLFLAGAFLASCEAFSPKAPEPVVKPKMELSKAAAGAFAAMTVASSVALTNLPANAISNAALSWSPGSSQVVAETVTREGIYGEYEVEVTPQQYDDARSTFKPAKETKSKKGKYTAILAILIVGSFVVPMAQYWWYVKDDDSSERFFAEDVPEPQEKKKWF